MAKAAILYGGDVKRITNFSELAFNYRSGFLIRFKYGGDIYAHTTANSFRPEHIGHKDATGGYYKEVEFLKYLAKDNLLSDIVDDKLPYIESAKEKDDVIVRKLKIESPYEKCYEIIEETWPYVTNSTLLDGNGNIIIPDGASKDIKEGEINVIAKNFYNKNIQLIKSNSFTEDKDLGALLVTLIALNIYRIHKDIFLKFYKTPTFNSYVNAQNTYWATGNIFVNPTIKDLNDYHNKINSFYHSFYSNQVAIQKESDERKLYALALVLSENALDILTVDYKLDVLQMIALGLILGGTSKVIPGQINEEDFVIKIVNSIDDSDADDFLNGLITRRTFKNKKVITLFQSLYTDVDDRGFGTANLQILMDKIYDLWLKSSYYPYNNDETVKPNLINPNNYSSKPIVLDYESGTVLGPFSYSKYHFNFDEEEIYVYTSLPIWNQTSTYIEQKVGTYGMYQTVTIKNSDTNTERTNFISVNINGKENAALPIFYLMYLDDKKITQNLVSTLGLTFDVALTFTGIGNLAKLRHIRSVYNLGRAALKLPVASGQTLIAYELAQGAAGLIEVSTSLASIILDYWENYDGKYCVASSPDYNQADCDFYTEFADIILYLQFFSGALDLVSSIKVRKAAKRLLDGPIPEDLDPNARILLQKFAGDMDQIRLDFRDRLFDIYQTYDTPIWNRVNNGVSSGYFSIAQRDEFILDFERANKEVLHALNINDGNLIGYWKEIIPDFKYKRIEIPFLEDFRFIKNSEEVNTEIFKGKITPQATDMPGQFEWNAVGVHHQNALKSKNLGGVGKIDGQPIPVGPPNAGYYKAKVELYHEDFVGADGSKYKKKKKMSTFFPNTWIVEKVQQELAFALPNKVHKGGNLYVGTMSDGVDVVFHIENGVIKSAYPSIK